MVILYVLLEIRPNREISPQAEIPDQTLKGWFSGKGWNYGLQEVAGIKAGKIGRETEKSGVFEEVTKGSPNSNHCCFCFQVCTLVGRLSAAPGSYLANKSLYLCPVQFLACPHLQNTEMVSSPCSWLARMDLSDSWCIAIACRGSGRGSGREMLRGARCVVPEGPESL